MQRLLHTTPWCSPLSVDSPVASGARRRRMGRTLHARHQSFKSGKRLFTIQIFRNLRKYRLGRTRIRDDVGSRAEGVTRDGYSGSGLALPTPDLAAPDNSPHVAAIDNGSHPQRAHLCDAHPVRTRTTRCVTASFAANRTAKPKSKQVPKCRKDQKSTRKNPCRRRDGGVHGSAGRGDVVITVLRS